MPVDHLAIPLLGNPKRNGMATKQLAFECS